jgi:hypothetical protein
MTYKIKIPGELTLSNPVPPPIDVSLPIIARPTPVKNILLGLLSLMPSALLFFGGVTLAIVLTSFALGTASPDLKVSANEGLVLFAVALFMLPFGIAGIGAALTCFWDAARPGPVLRIDAAGLFDHRSGLSVPWSAIRRAKILYNGSPFTIDLKLDSAAAPWQNPFRVGILGFRFRSLPDEMLVSIAYLDIRTHVLAYTILTLTQLHGGEAISASPGPLDMGLKIIPRGTV